MHIWCIPACVLPYLRNFGDSTEKTTGLTTARRSLFSSFMIAFVLFLSLIAYRYTLPKLKLKKHYSADSQVVLRATDNFDDVLNLLGTPEQAASVNPQVAQQLMSCFKYLVPPLSSIDNHGSKLCCSGCHGDH